jgi:hypothetical protein
MKPKHATSKKATTLLSAWSPDTGLGRRNQFVQKLIKNKVQFALEENTTISV